jgi:hypothetical protein
VRERRTEKRRKSAAFGPRHAPPKVRIQARPPFSPSHTGIIRESCKIGPCARDCDHVWTRRASPAALIAGIRRNVSASDFARSISKAAGIGRICPARVACGRPYDL